MLLELALVTAIYRPAAPTVGDRIVIDFEKPVVLTKSADYEVVSQSGPRVIIRSFQPKPFPLAGKVGDVHFRNMVVPMKSVLAPDDQMAPAPLAPPRQTAWGRTPLVLIGLAGLLAAVLWALVWRSRKAAVVTVGPVSKVPPAEAFRAAVQKARTARQKWAALADATRAYLAARMIRADLTTREVLILTPLLLERFPEQERRAFMTTLAEILRRGDLQKFSPWGIDDGDFEALAARAVQLIDAFEPAAVLETAA